MADTTLPPASADLVERVARECGQCLEMRFCMPVQSDTMGHRFTEHLCMPCRLDFDRAAALRLVWATPDADALVACMARVSAPDNQANTATAPRLIGYLIRNRHWSPFEMVSLCMEVTTTRDVARQLLRHRSFSFQEFSQRYAAVDALPEAPLREARMQDPKNRQASVACDDLALANWWIAAQDEVSATARNAYQLAVKSGIAKEVARAVLPEGLTTSRLYMAGTARSWLHFCDVRRGNGTQPETQAIADAAWAVMQGACPAICEAWDKREVAHG